MRDVRAGGLVADEQLGRDLAVRLAVGDQRQDVDLARGQLEPRQRGDDGAAVGGFVEIDPRTSRERLELFP